MLCDYCNPAGKFDFLKKPECDNEWFPAAAICAYVEADRDAPLQY